MKKTSYYIIALPIAFLVFTAIFILYLAGEKYKRELWFSGKIIEMKSDIKARNLLIEDIRTGLKSVEYDSIAFTIKQSDQVSGTILRGPEEAIKRLRLSQRNDSVAVTFDWSDFKDEAKKSERRILHAIMSRPVEIILPTAPASLESRIDASIRIEHIACDSLKTGYMPELLLSRCQIGYLDITSERWKPEEGHLLQEMYLKCDGSYIENTILNVEVTNLIISGHNGSVINTAKAYTDSRTERQPYLTINIPIYNLSTDCKGSSINIESRLDITSMKLE